MICLLLAISLQFYLIGHDFIHVFDSWVSLSEFSYFNMFAFLPLIKKVHSYQ